MKKTILLFAACIISYSNSFAQKFHFGLGVTPGLAWIHAGSDDITGDGSKFGFNYGLITEFAFTENYAFATGLTVDHKGGKIKTKEEIFIDSATTDFIYSDFNLRYVEVPATIKMKTNQIGYIRYYGQFGVAPAFLIGAKGTTRAGSNIVADDVDIKEGVNNVNISLVIGLGLEYNLSGNTNLLVGFLYKNGFSDIIDGDPKGNVNTLGLNLGILF